MKAIVAVDANWGIGLKGQLLARIPADMKYFKEHTINKIVVMGQVTFNSLPNGKPLPERTNIVLSDDKGFAPRDVTVCHSLEDLWAKLPADRLGDTFIIGGESIYRQLLPYCREALVTKMENSFPADKFFPNLDEMPGWKLVEVGNCMRHNNIDFQFTRYIKK